MARFFLARPDTFFGSPGFFLRLVVSLAFSSSAGAEGKKAGSSSFNFLALVYALRLRVALECPSGNRDKNSGVSDSAENFRETFIVSPFLERPRRVLLIEIDAGSGKFDLKTRIGTHELDGVAAGAPNQLPFFRKMRVERVQQQGKRRGACNLHLSPSSSTEIRTLRSSVPVEMARHRTPGRRLHRYALCNIH